MKYLINFWVAFLVISIFTGCSTKELTTDFSKITKKIQFNKNKDIKKITIGEINSVKPNSIDKVYQMKLPNQRIENKLKHFPHEYKKITTRRELFKLEENNSSDTNITSITSIKPKNLIGFGFSGGGIRANAFQLGIMSGLSEVKVNESANLLNRIDYISSVSGGSWANGAYWVSDESDEKFFSCFDEVARGFGGLEKKECAVYEPSLRYEQFQVITRSAWLDAIKKESLMGKDLYFSKINRDSKYEYLKKKPYPIFNITHSAIVLEMATPDNFTFEITPDYFGTIVDCGSGDRYCGIVRKQALGLFSGGLKKGFFVGFGSKDIKITRELFLEDRDFEDGDSLSKALHTSSAVVGKLLSMQFKIKYRDRYIEELRELYTLSDGGKSDNIGITALVERGVDLIIISQMSADPEMGFEDLKISSSQVKKLLKRDVKLSKIVNYGKKLPLLVKSSYNHNGKEEGSIFYIKPTIYNVDEFITHLKSIKDEYNEYKYPLVIKALKDDGLGKAKEKIDGVGMLDEIKEEFRKFRGKSKEEDNLDRFPQTPTFQVKYPRHLIYAYYLLGNYISKKYISKEIIEWLNDKNITKQ